MDPSDSHQPFNFTTNTSTYVPENVTAQNIPPTQTVNESNRVEPVVQPQVDPVVQPHVEPVVQPHVEPVVQPHVEPQGEPHVEGHAASEVALVPVQPSSNRRPYTDMIYDAIVALNEPEGSSKLAISRYIRWLNPNGLPDDHDDLLGHHLQVMKNCGILTMVKKSYKLADFPPQNVAAAVDPGLVASGSESPRTDTGPLDMLASAVDTGMVLASESEIPPIYTGSLDLVPLPASGSASQPQKRGRGRPPKPKTDAPQQQQPIDAQPISQALQPYFNVEPNAVQPSGEQPVLPVTPPSPVVKEPAKRGPGRPRKDGSGPSTAAVMMKARGWPMSSRASVPAPASLVPSVANAAGRLESPGSGGSGGVATLSPAGEVAMAVAAVMKRGRGRPPKRGGGRTAGRPIQYTPRPVMRAAGAIQEPGYGELKRKLDLANEKVKEILNVLGAGIATGDNQAVVQVAQELEGLIPVLTVEPQAMEAAPMIEAETQGMELGQGSEGGGEQTQILTQPQPQTLTQLQPQTLPLPQNLTEPQPHTMPLPQTLNLTEPEPQILHELEPQTQPELEPQTQPELEPLPELETLLDVEQPLPLTQPQIQPNTEAEAMDEDKF